MSQVVEQSPLEQQRAIHPAPLKPSPFGLRSEWTRNDWRWIWIITAIAFAFRLYHLTYRSLWTDEFHTLGPVQMPLLDMMRERIQAGHLPTYFLMMKGWVSLAGTTDWALRFPSAVIGTLLVPASVLLGRRILPKPFVFALACIAATNSLAVWASQEARMYALFSVVSVLFHLFYLRTLTEGGTRNWVRYLAILLIGTTVHPLMLVHFLGHMMASYLLRADFPAQARAMKRFVGILLIGAVPGIAAYLILQQKAGLRFDIQNPLPIGRQLTKLMYGNTVTFDWYREPCVVMTVIAAIGLVRAWPKGAEGTTIASKPMLKFCLAVVLTPLLALWTAEWFVPSVFGQEKYYVPALVPLWILGIVGIWSYRSKSRAWFIAISAFLLLAGLIGQWKDRGQGGREIVRYVAKHARPDDVVLIRPSGGTKAMIEHYGGAHLNLAIIKDKQSHEAIRQDIKQAVAGYNRAWLFSYRAENRIAIREALTGYSELFEYRGSKKFPRSASLVLLKVKKPAISANDTQTSGVPDPQAEQ